MWEFAVGLIMLELQPGSLRLVAISGLLTSAAKCLAGGHVGLYVDRCLPPAFRIFFIFGECEEDGGLGRGPAGIKLTLV